MRRLRSYQLAIEFYREAKSVALPRHLKDQLHRAASSIALDLSEGCGRRTMPDRLRFFGIAMGSIRECQAIVAIEAERFSESLRDLLDHLAASTFKVLRNSSR